MTVRVSKDVELLCIDKETFIKIADQIRKGLKFDYERDRRTHTKSKILATKSTNFLDQVSTKKTFKKATSRQINADIEPLQNSQPAFQRKKLNSVPLQNIENFHRNAGSSLKTLTEEASTVKINKKEDIQDDLNAIKAQLKQQKDQIENLQLF